MMILVTVVINNHHNDHEHLWSRSSDQVTSVYEADWEPELKDWGEVSENKALLGWFFFIFIFWFSIVVVIIHVLCRCHQQLCMCSVFSPKPVDWGEKTGGTVHRALMRWAVGGGSCWDVFLSQIAHRLVEWCFCQANEEFKSFLLNLDRRLHMEHYGTATFQSLLGSSLPDALIVWFGGVPP